MKNRIWKKILAVGVSLLAEAGMLVGCTAQPAVAYGAEMEGGLSVAQDAAWTDLQKFQAVISVKADGLASLTWENETRNMKVAMKIYSAVEIRTGAWKMINMIFRMKQYLIQHLTNW